MPVLFSETFDSFRGSGFAPVPAAGQLDSDLWRITGVDEGDVAFGSTRLTGDPARGVASAAVTTGGLYALNQGGGDHALWIQPTGDDFTPGAVFVRVLNTTGATLTAATISFDFLIRNDQARGQSFVFSYSSDGSSYQTPTGGSLTTPAVAAGSAVTETELNFTIDNLTVASGEYLYLQFSTNDASGSGSRDEFGIDDLQISTDGGGSTTPLVTVTATDAQATEGVDAGLQFTFTRTGSTTEALTVSYTLGGTATAGADYVAPSGTITFAAGSATAVLDVTALDDAAEEPNETVVVTVADGENYDVGTNGSATAVLVSDEVGITKISAVQGSGSASAMVGQTVTVEAVVVGDFQNGDADAARNLGGFFIQEERGDADGDASTSEGLFVFQGDGASALPGVTEGTKVRVTGTVVERFGKTSLENVTVTVLAEGALGEVDAAVLNLPSSNLEAFENMLVTVPTTLVVRDQGYLESRGEVNLYAPELDANGNRDGFAGLVDEAADGRPYQFTQTNAPSVSGNAAYEAEVKRRTVIYDDGVDGAPSTVANPSGGGAYGTSTAIQNGDSITGLTGILDFGFSNYRIRSTDNGQNSFTDSNPREEAPAAVGGSLKVATFNVLNFFVTLNASGNTVDGGGTPRGANTAAEFARQTEKLVNTLLTIDADVFALIELENDFTRPANGDFVAAGNAIGYLVQQLNLKAGAGTYDWVYPGQDRIGTDVIANGFIYKPGKVAVAAGSSVAVDYAAVNDRPTVAVTFEELATGGRFTAYANHFKSKGSGGGDIGDGQGQANADRLAQAQRLATWAATNPTGVNDADRLLLGDFNAYYSETPIDVLEGAGYQVIGTAADYSYTFAGQSNSLGLLGSLDHAIASGSLQGQITGSTKWHVNSDEAELLDYNREGRDPGIFDGTKPYRSSDHDPIIVGLNLTPTPITGTGANETLTGRAGRDTIDGAGGNDTVSGAGGDDLLNGGSGDDFVYGGVGEDSLFGGLGADKLYGDEGADRLEGGAGVDSLFGGAGLDTFVISILDGDVIHDWTKGDRIDLSDLQASSLRLIRTGGNTRVDVDLDGDGKADGSFVVLGTAVKLVDFDWQ